MRKIIQEAISGLKNRLRRNELNVESNFFARIYGAFQESRYLKYLLFGIVAALAFFLWNKQEKPMMASSISRVPTLMVTGENGNKEPLKISKLKIDVDIKGNVVTTTMDMTFYNPQSSVREGQLNFPLENEQVVSRFAMELNGKLREGVVVEKEKGRRTFETIVRKGVDPALLEMTKGNNFRARVYPIPMNGYKRIVVGYEEELDADDNAWWYHLGLGFEELVDSFELNIDVAEHSNSPTIEAVVFNDLAFKKVKKAYQEIFEASFKALNYAPAKGLKVKIPFSKSKKPIVLATSTKDETYFYIHQPITPIIKKTPNPKQVTLIWDVSNSSKNRKIFKELSMLNRFFEKVKNVEVELVVFSNAVHFEQNFSIKNGEWSELTKVIKGLEYDGGTRLSAIDLSKYKSDKIILSTDGLTTFGKSELKLTKTPIVVFNSNASSDEAYLKYIASASGGKYFDFNHNHKYELEKGILTESYQFISAVYNKNLVSNTYPSIKTPVEQQFSFAGILKGKEAIITLNFGIGDKILHSETVKVSKTSKGKDYVQRLWAKKAVNQFMMQPKKYEQEITEMGKKYSLVTPYTSLIVLENVEDYVDYEIEPPAELLEEYLELMAIKKEAERKALALEDDGLKEELERLRNWWKKERQLAKKKKSETTTRLNDGTITITATDNTTLEYSIDGGANWEASDVSANLNSGTYNISVREDDAVEEATEEAEEAVEEAAEEVEEGIDEVLEMEDIGDVPRTMPPPSPPNESETDDLVQTNATSADEFNTNQDIAEVKNMEVTKSKKTADYIIKLRKTNEDNLYTEYLKLKNEDKRNATFYLEVGSYFLEKNKKSEAIRILSNIAEMELENRELLKIVANKLRQIKEYDLAIEIYEEIIRIRGEEPQAFRDLALAHLERGNYQKALDLLYKVISESWEENEKRFTGIKTIALIEMNNIIALHRGKVNISAIPKDLIQNYPMDIRIVLNWSSDNVDVDLWVTDPNGEKCFYSNKETRLGGRISNDMTSGYGPEEFLLKKAIAGNYKIEADFYGDTRQGVNGNVTIDAQLFTNYGRSNQKMKEITLTLSGVKQVVQVGSLDF